MSKEFLDAFADLKKEKNLSEEEIIGAIKDSIENAFTLLRSPSRMQRRYMKVMKSAM